MVIDMRTWTENAARPEALLLNYRHPAIFLVDQRQ